MSEVVSFKSGKDLGTERAAEEDALTCTDCPETATLAAAFDAGWQFAPPLCPSCCALSIARSAACCHGVRA